MRCLGLGLMAVWLGSAGAYASLPVPRQENRNGEFQFRFDFDNRGVDGKAAHPSSAYLWIPPSARKVRGLIVTQQNVGEQPFVEHPAIREACAQNDFAIFWCCPPSDIRFEKDREAAVHLLEEVLQKLGDPPAIPRTMQEMASLRHTAQRTEMLPVPKETYP